MTNSALRVPISNVYGGGDYTAPIAIGSSGTTANVILDTGSSTLAVVPTVYDVTGDSDAETTPLAQDVIYGTGGWAGPVVTTKVLLGTEGAALKTDIAVTADDEPGGFGQADGILGLAYNVLNSAYDLSAYLKQHGDRSDTFPWPFPTKNTSAAVQQVGSLLQRMRCRACAPPIPRRTRSTRVSSSWEVGPSKPTCTRVSSSTWTSSTMPGTTRTALRAGGRRRAAHGRPPARAVR